MRAPGRPRCARATRPWNAWSSAPRGPPRRQVRHEAARRRASPSSRASRSSTVPPSSGRRAAPGGNAGLPPSRRRRAIAGRACARLAAEPLAGAEHEPRPRAARASEPARKGGGRSAGLRPTTSLRVERGGREQLASRASPATFDARSASSRGARTWIASRPGQPDDVAARGGRGQPPQRRARPAGRAPAEASGVDDDARAPPGTSAEDAGEPLARGLQELEDAPRRRRRRPLVAGAEVLASPSRPSHRVGVRRGTPWPCPGGQPAAAASRS